MSDETPSTDLPASTVEALRALRWPDPAYFDTVARIFSDVAFPLEWPGVVAEALTPVQRQLAIAFTELDLPSPLHSGFPAHRAVRRRWLGLDPKGPLERSITFTMNETTYVEPIWRLSRIVRGMWNKLPVADYRGLCERFEGQFAIEERLRLWGEVNSMQPTVWGLSHVSFFEHGMQPELIDQLHGEGADWAVAYLDGVLEADDAKFATRDLIPPFMALVRAGVPIESRWYALIPWWFRYARELLAALPESRRADVALASLERQHPANAFKVIVEVLPVLPDVALTKLALSCIPKSVGSPRKFRRALRDAAGTHEDILALIDAADAEAGPPLVLTPTSERSIAAEGPSAVFSELDKEQLVVAGKRYLGGKGAPIEVLLAHDPKGPDEERSLRGQLFYRAIADAKGKHVYDAWLYQADSGTVFKAGTSRVAAEYAQCSVTCKNERLAEALEEALRAEPAAVTASRASPAKKPASQKATKKPT